MAGVFAHGVEVRFGSPTPNTLIPNVANITLSGTDVEEIDVTTHDTSGRMRQYIAGFVDPGELTLELNFDPNQTAHRATTGGLIALRDSGAITRWRITYPTTPVHSVEFDGYVKSFDQQLPADDAMKATCTVRITGAATWTYGNA